MEEFDLKQDVSLVCVRAYDFPEGIQQAFERLQARLQTSDDRAFYGISFPAEEGGMIYIAAASVLNTQELQQFEGEKMKLRQGKYITITVKNWKENVGSIGLAFRALGDSSYATVPPGIEWYQGKDVVCMLPIKAP